jgi:hypothetical protein
MKTKSIEGESLQGRKVLLSESAYRGSVEDRLFIAEDGFGCYPFTRGTAVIGRFVKSGEEARVERFEIEGIVEE